MNSILLIAQIAVSIVVVVLILVQGGGAGLGSAWGGSGESFQTRRGVEKIVIQLTVVAIVVFFILSVAQLLMKK